MSIYVWLYSSCMFMSFEVLFFVSIHAVFPIFMCFFFFSFSLPLSLVYPKRTFYDLYYLCFIFNIRTPLLVINLILHLLSKIYSLFFFFLSFISVLSLSFYPPSFFFFFLSLFAYRILFSSLTICFVCHLFMSLLPFCCPCMSLQRRKTKKENRLFPCYFFVFLSFFHLAPFFIFPCVFVFM